MRPLKRVFWAMGRLCMVAVLGCRVPGQIAWSPDGSLAAYRIEDKAFLIDSTGKIVTSLGGSAGGYAWSADSKTLYYANESELANPVTVPDTKWRLPQRLMKTGAELTAPTTQPASKPAKFVELQAFAGGKATSLVKFAAGKALHMALSPDQAWVAVVCDAEVPDTFAVYLLNLPTKQLYLLSDAAGFAMCFTGPNRLAYVEPDRAADSNENVTGKVVEVTLNVTAPSLERTPLIDVIPAQTPCMAPLGENMLLTSIARSFPGKPTADDKLVCKLFMWTRANCGIVSLADDVGPLFAPSPDGSRILIEKITPATEQMPAKRELQLIRANGSDGNTLRDLSHRDIFALWPAWRGNSEITFTSPEEDAKTVAVNNEQHLQYDVVQYKITEKGQLEAIKTLSESWENAMKPYIPIQIPATQSTTKEK